MLNDVEYAHVTAAAAKQGVPVPVYIRSRILDEENEFTRAYAETLRRVEALPIGTKFNLKTLFGTDWSKFHASASNIGKAFCDLVCSGSVADVKVLGKGGSTGNMQYERL